ncbi:1-acyl-sn-glycerol-3-phosphate acyltransferase [Carboxylicivirga sediminis]|uniref:1-acyl-sn-glycerol-3-phosphate acyltransferase n=1 Tax=Carboxylicivirga sediminis TaxID=2006564 RepID=A0A941F3T5_9BACT|nr:lysophospholipid acyltransferase family protein [Carboxylicivirga sediminis]MBR8536261.1 1-acyl-sn-glycerol-3-phosphate acyltransferase [Carboxylicivirga sediminis]
MRKVLGFLLTPIFHLYFGLVLVIFHPFQVIGHKLFGDHARRKVVDTLNFFLVKGLYIMGCRIKFSGFEQLPEGRPVIIVSNHQSLYDIPAVVHGFRKYYPKFISKIELGKNLPSISYNLIHGKSALIDRKNGSQSVKEIFKLGRLIQANNYAACIFPEGTRSKTGRVKKFMTAGLNTLLRAAPDAIIIPFVIDGHSRMMYKGMFPLKFGEKISYTALEPIEPKGKDVEELTADIQQLIKNKLEQSV